MFTVMLSGDSDCLLQRLDSSDDSGRHQPSTSVLNVAAITRDQAGVYRCHATNDAGNATIDVNVVVECKTIALLSLTQRPSTEVFGRAFYSLFHSIWKRLPPHTSLLQTMKFLYSVS